jgi:hypothetical protein
MRRALACALVLLGATCGPAVAALPTGAPRELRTSRPADALPHPGALLEEWSLQLVDPRSQGRMAVRVKRSYDEGSGADVVMFADGLATTEELSVMPAARGALVWRGPDGELRLTRRGAGWHLRFSFTRTSGEITLRRARPGVTARLWRLGQEAWLVDRTNASLSWAAPIGTSFASGRVRIGDRELRLRRWRGSLEHRWGHLSDEWRAWEYLGTGVVHTRGGGAWIVHGMNRGDFLTGAGARDAFWLGVMAHVGARGTTFCRPRIARRRWAVSINGPFFVEVLRASCGGRRIAFRRLRDTGTSDGGSAWLRDEARAAARPRGAAWIRYAGHPF